MSQIIKCSEAGCDEYITFDYGPIPGTLYIYKEVFSGGIVSLVREKITPEEVYELNENKSVTAFLTCRKGHINSYTVEIPSTGK